MKEPLRAQLERSAKRRGVSINAEVVSRLDRSFLEEMARHNEFGSPRVHAAAKLFARVLAGLEETTDRHAFGDLGDPFLHTQAWRAMNEWFLATRPPGEEKLPQDIFTIPKALIKEAGSYLMREELRRVERADDPSLPEAGHRWTEDVASAQLLKKDSKTKEGQK